MSLVFAGVCSHAPGITGRAARAEPRDRVALFRLAWDASMSMFGARQALYERFFFGDPVRMAGAFFNTYDKQPYMERVRDFIREGMDA